MDKLEHYLDQVCWGVGGPRSLRQHLRAELREHLQDAAAAYRAAGATEDEALTRALEDFGGAEQVRAELEATHGHRLTAMIVDKALQWKEITMRAKRVWTTWAHVVLLAVIALEVVFILSMMVFIVPKCREIIAYEWPMSVDPAADAVVAWFRTVIDGVAAVMHVWMWWVIPLAVLWGLFEWRYHSEHKLLVRLSGLGTAALGLLIVVVITAAAIVLPLTMVAPNIRTRPPEPIVRQEVTRINAGLKALERAAAAKDWDTIDQSAREVARGVDALTHLGAAAATLLSLGEQAKVDEIRAQLKAASESISEAQRAIWDKDPHRLEAALREFQAEYDRAEGVTTRPAR